MAEKTLSLDGRPRPEPAPILPAGALLDGRYRIVRLLAEGGMGAVYEAEAVRIGRPVALKILDPVMAREPSEVERFRREARAAVQVASPHVVQVLDFGLAATGELFLVMELLPGESLRDRLEREGSLAPPLVAELLRQLLRGLAAAHRAGIVHRDLKPDNLWLVPEEGRERLTILDFGIAKQAGHPGGAQTQSGLVVGTPEYLSPEQAVGGEVDHRADLYSAGLVAWVLLTGRHPFPTGDTRALLRAQAFDPVPSPERVLPALADHPALLRVIDRATVKDRAGRAQSAEELLAVLDGREGGGRQTPRAVRPEGPRRRTARPVTSLLRPVVAGLPRARMATLLAVRIEGWEALAAGRRPDEQARLLLAHDRLVVPALRTMEGRRALVAGPTLVGAFASPTNAVLCAMAVQDRVAAWNATAPDPDRLALRLGLHAGELAGGRVAAGLGALPLAEEVRDLAPPGAIWLTRAVALTMNQSEVPLEPLADSLTTPAGERLSLYRVRPNSGPLPFGGREAARVPREDRVSRFMSPVSDTLRSLGDGGEGRGRAALRIAGATATLLAVSAAHAGVLVAGGAVVVTGRLAGVGREPAWAARALERVRAARRWLGRRFAVGRAALERPLRARPAGRA